MLLMLFLAGCISRGQHELTEVQLDATRTAYQAATAKCQEEIYARDTRVSELEQQLGELRTQFQAEGERCAALQQDLSQFHAQEAVQGAEAGLGSAEEIRAALDAFAAVQVEREARSKLAQDVASRFGALAEGGKVSVVTTNARVAVRIGTDQLFNANTVTLSPRGEQIVADVARALGPSAGWTVRIEGHTDAVPRHSAEYPSNWELGFAQAMTVLRHLQDEGVTATMSAASFADGVPVADNATAEGREQNRRLEIVLRPPPLAGP
jgi:chemotaxis protein MotB